MTELYPAEDAPRGLAAAALALEAGGCVVLPTDTVYGLAARPDVAGATDRLFDLKRRPRDLTLPILVAGVTDAEGVARLDERARRLAERWWPGALTLVLPRAPAAARWDLGAQGASVGVRVPDHGVARALLSRTGPLAVTSANVSGEPPAPTCEGVMAALGDEVDVYLCDEGEALPLPSTVVELVGDEPRILREGAIAPEEILAALD